MDAKNVHKAKLIPGQQKIVENGTEQGLPGLDDARQFDTNSHVQYQPPKAPIGQD